MSIGIGHTAHCDYPECKVIFPAGAGPGPYFCSNEHEAMYLDKRFDDHSVETCNTKFDNVIEWPLLGTRCDFNTDTPDA